MRPIERMAIEKIAGDKISLYQLIVQYEDGEIMCFYEEKYCNFLILFSGETVETKLKTQTNWFILLIFIT